MNLKFLDFFNRFRSSNKDKETLNQSSSKNGQNLLPSLAYVQITEPLPLKIHRKKNREKTIQKFASILSSKTVICLDKLRDIAWVGIPLNYKSRCWRLLLDYEPTNIEQTETVLRHKRADYFNCKTRLFNQQSLWTSVERLTLNQISVDIPRTPILILHDQRVSRLFTSVLFIWAVRHPASGYVQGMNDVLLPFFICFILPFYPTVSLNNFYQLDNIDLIDDESLNSIEADCFWCFSRLMDGIQDVYTRDQPGIHRMIKNLDKVVSSTSPDLSNWIKKEHINYINFTIRWFNCLVVREFKLQQLFRIWDLFVSDSSKIPSKLVYVCAAMMKLLTPMLINLPKAEFIETIQTIHQDFWTDERVEMILAQSFVFEKNIDIEEIVVRG